MKNSKKTILIIIAIILAFVTILVIYLGSKDNGTNVEQPTEISKEFSKVNDYNEFFSIQNTINDNLDTTKSFVAKKIYTNNDSTTKYYFVNGSITEILMDDVTTNYEKSVNYLIIVETKSNSYELNRLNDNISNLLNYANSYDVKHQEINGNKNLKQGNDNIKSILTSYIEHFKNMLYFDNELAYSMLTDETKSKYTNYDDFKNQMPDIYNSISSSIFSYASKEDDNVIEYFVKDNNQKDIKIVEYSIMDFKISY